MYHKYFRKWLAKQALITDVFRMYKQCAISDILKFNSSGLTYMKKVNDITDWLSQTTDILKYFVWPLDFEIKSCLYI